jgi:hypothetical protein
MATPSPKEARRLTLVEIVMNADAEVIKAAYEARVEVDKLLAQREEAYRRIAELETRIEDVIGQPGVFIFPPPPLAVAGLEAGTARPRKPARPSGEAAPSQAPAEAASDARPAATAGRAAATAEAPVTGPAEKPHAGRGDGAERPAPRTGGPSSRASHGG